MSRFYTLDFEKPVLELEQRIEAAETRLRQEARTNTPADAAELAAGTDADPALAQLRAEISDLREQHQRRLVEVYSDLSPWNTVRVARHPDRPQTRDYIGMICRDFVELCGDRRYGDDPAIVTGFGRIGPVKCLVVGHQKGKETSEKIACHFGCAHPEGYRKALAKMQLAEKFGQPIVTFVDTPGAYPGLGAEQRGQAEAIAVNMREMSRLRVPIVTVVIGEGGSGGALGIAVADKVAMLRNSWYSVISPEGCAAILWKEANEQTNTAAARALKLTAQDNLGLGIIDTIIDEPVGGAHRNPKGAALAIQDWVVRSLRELSTHEPATLLANRYARFRKLGEYVEPEARDAPPAE